VIVVAIAGWQAVIVLREQATVRGHALRVRGAADAAAGGLRLLLRVQEPSACSPSSLHCVQMPRLVEVRLRRQNVIFFSECTSEVLFMLGKKALVEMNESNTESKGNSAIV
jgi:hypothetical protein